MTTMGLANELPHVRGQQESSKFRKGQRFGEKGDGKSVDRQATTAASSQVYIHLVLPP